MIFYLKNIDWLGSYESMIYLDSIEETNKLENVMTTWNKENDCRTFEQFDWDKKTEFKNLDMYNKDYKHLDKKILCCLKDIEI